ncbi:hypothetical protein LOTGIDRAFT_166788 [Lottia gigantea]|uniref:DRBM domain-containing protein n=1 Tax=Lottia gigantea TaxID=225164 RepID=V4BDL1_LOTGI|nr:hypothetical protein LOTGIDRAFT_166788 [Lottia gigantea]ESO86789.1 hypothetical protein LOTGIDRAFT_166788 [Lottia gigantea]
MTRSNIAKADSMSEFWVPASNITKKFEEPILSDEEKKAQEEAEIKNEEEVMLGKADPLPNDDMVYYDPEDEKIKHMKMENTEASASFETKDFDRFVPETATTKDEIFIPEDMKLPLIDEKYSNPKQEMNPINYSVDTESSDMGENSFDVKMEVVQVKPDTESGYVKSTKAPVMLLNEKISGLVYEVISSSNDPKNPEFEMKVTVQGEDYTARAKSKKLAKQEVARLPLMKLFKIVCVPDSTGSYADVVQYSMVCIWVTPGIHMGFILGNVWDTAG